jgi:ligand-binding sensor domain-containing protein
MKKLTAIIKYLFFPFLFAQSAGTTDWSSIISNEAVTAKLETQNTAWVGTHKGLWVINTKTMKATHLTAQNSVLPSNEVTSIITTKNGNVYVATPNGIFRYDCYAYLVINSENSNLPESGITSIATDKSDNLWIGTTNKGLVLMNNYKCKFFNTQNSVLTTNNITMVTGDNGGNIYVQLSNGSVIGITASGMSVIMGPKVADPKAIASRN